jgi:hypothetical protein
MKLKIRLNLKKIRIRSSSPNSYFEDPERKPLIRFLGNIDPVQNIYDAIKILREALRLAPKYGRDAKLSDICISDATSEELEQHPHPIHQVHVQLGKFAVKHPEFHEALKKKFLIL